MARVEMLEEERAALRLQLEARKVSQSAAVAAKRLAEANAASASAAVAAVLGAEKCAAVERRRLEAAHDDAVAALELQNEQLQQTQGQLALTQVQLQEMAAARETTTSRPLAETYGNGPRPGRLVAAPGQHEEVATGDASYACMHTNAEAVNEESQITQEDQNPCVASTDVMSELHRLHLLTGELQAQLHSAKLAALSASHDRQVRSDA